MLLPTPSSRRRCPPVGQARFPPSPPPRPVADLWVGAALVITRKTREKGTKEKEKETAKEESSAGHWRQRWVWSRRTGSRQRRQLLQQCHIQESLLRPSSPSPRALTPRPTRSPPPLPASDASRPPALPAGAVSCPKPLPAGAVEPASQPAPSWNRGMGDYARPSPSRIFEGIVGILRKCFFYILSFGPMPTHVAFIMDGNRRFTQKQRMESGAGHRAGFLALMSVLQYCYEMGINYVTVYAFSIDNFRRKPEEVESMMDLMLEKIEELLKEESLVTKYGVRINFWGKLQLLSEPVRLAAEKAMAVTAKNSGPMLSVCVAYTSTDEITHAVQESCKERLDSAVKGCLDGCNVTYGACSGELSVKDVEKYLYTAGCPDPDIVIRTSGETRLSNFLLWQTTHSHLQNPSALWPEFSIRHLVWAILEYQRAQPYLEKGRKFSL